MQEFSPEQIEDERRLRYPKTGELLGMTEERLAGAKLRVSCTDGKIRLVRIPGKLRRRVWVRVGDIVLIKPWEDDNDKADLVWRYFRGQADILKRKGYLKGIY
ncbi:MAG: translation initiation factor eIF-1A [Candidatus Diapherotrites archaeon]|nr:translation initiation factor eIF-1A [Candidatus Diapherotrites archaeon]